MPWTVQSLIGAVNPLGEVKGFDHGRPLWSGPPFAAAKRYLAIVDFWKSGKVAKGIEAQPWFKGNGPPAFYGPSNALADLEAYGPKFVSGFAGRRRTLPADASFMVDAYGTERVDRYPGIGGNPDSTDEYGRHFAGVSGSMFDQVMAIGAIVAPYIPGWGPALAATIALAQGKELDDAILAGIKGYLPGGPMAGLAFDFGVAVALGEPIDQAALDAAVKATPEGALAYALAKTAMGQELDATAIQYLKDRYPYEAGIIEQNPKAWLSKQDGGPEAIAKGQAAPAPAPILSALVRARLIDKTKSTPASSRTFAQMAALVRARDPVLRAHRAIVEPNDRSWWIAGASVGLVPVGVVVARELARLLAQRGW